VDVRVPGPMLDDRPARNTIPRPSTDVAFGSQLRTTLEEGQRAVNRLIRSYDEVVADHHLAVAAVALGIARRLDLDPDTARGIELAASIHDIGVIGSPDTETAVRLAGSSDPEPVHSQAGAAIVDGIRFPWPIAVMILQHHERMDGSGFPDGVGGATILLSSRIIAVADTVVNRSDAVPNLTDALDLLVAGRGTGYDPRVVDACLVLLPRAPGGSGPDAGPDAGPDTGPTLR